jgi:hypothetical protein
MTTETDIWRALFDQGAHHRGLSGTYIHTLVIRQCPAQGRAGD